MADVEVYYGEASGKWVVEVVGSRDVSRYSTKKRAVREAEGTAQQIANQQKRRVVIDKYTRKNQYDGTEEILPV